MNNRINTLKDKTAELKASIKLDEIKIAELINEINNSENIRITDQSDFDAIIKDIEVALAENEIKKSELEKQIDNLLEAMDESING